MIGEGLGWVRTKIENRSHCVEFFVLASCSAGIAETLASAGLRPPLAGGFGGGDL